MFNPLANSRDFSLSNVPLIGTFSFRKIRNRLCTALLNASYSSFWSKTAVILFKDFAFVLFYIDKVFFGTRKMEAISLSGVFFSNYLSALYVILYDLFSAQRFVTTDAMIVKFQNVNKQCIRLSRSTDIWII